MQSLLKSNDKQLFLRTNKCALKLELEDIFTILFIQSFIHSDSSLIIKDLRWLTNLYTINKDQIVEKCRQILMFLRIEK